MSRWRSDVDPVDAPGMDVGHSLTQHAPAFPAFLSAHEYGNLLPAIQFRKGCPRDHAPSQAATLSGRPTRQFFAVENAHPEGRETRWPLGFVCIPNTSKNLER